MRNAQERAILRRRASVVVITLLVSGFAMAIGGGPSGAATTTPLEGSAFGVSAPDITLFGGAQPAFGPTPTVTLPTGGSATPLTGTDASENVVYGPATLFTSGMTTASTEGTQAGGSVTSSTTVSSISNTSGGTMTANSLSSTCTANGANSASTTVTNGVVDTNTDSNGNVLSSQAVPTNPSVGLTINGQIMLSATDTETFSWVFNEQTANTDGSITVTAAHYILNGPTAKGDVFIGRSTCGFTPSATTTTTVPATTTTTVAATTTTTVAATTTTTVGATTTTTVRPTTTTTVRPTTTTTVCPTTTTTVASKHGSKPGGCRHHK